MMKPEELKSLLDKSISEFKASQEAKSFSGRHPELGKMINCHICSRRHRSVQVCQQVFATSTREGEPLQGELVPPDGMTTLTKYQVVGRAPYKSKRVNPHYSKKRLQLVQRTQQLFPDHFGVWPSTEEKSAEMVAMQMARRQAREELEAKRGKKRAKLQTAQHNSRRINRGLIAGNSVR
jgi:hypothetical protein